VSWFSESIRSITGADKVREAASAAAAAQRAQADAIKAQTAQSNKMGELELRAAEAQVKTYELQAKALSSPPDSGPSYIPSPAPAPYGGGLPAWAWIVPVAAGGILLLRRKRK
jgi:hypothetical protein